MPTPEQRYQGGMTTFERYGRAHYARISNGRPRRARYSPKEKAGRPPGASVSESTQQEKQ